jgi:hypothetical protein
MTTGSKNTILGAFTGNQGGLDIRTASNYIVLSDGDGNPMAYAKNVTGTYATNQWTFGGYNIVGVASNAETVIIGDTAAGYALMLQTQNTAVRFMYKSDPAGSTNAVVGSITVTGSATAYNTSSDYRLKHDIAPMTGALAKVAALKPVTYKWNADGSDGEGFIAHELAEVVPQCVTGEKDGVDADGNPEYQGIDTSFLVATLTAAIQEQQAIIESLKARLDAANI